MRRTLDSYVRTVWASPIDVWKGSSVADAESAATFCATQNKIGLLVAIVTIYALDGANFLLILCKSKQWHSVVQVCYAGVRFISRTRLILANVFASASPSTLRHTCALLGDKWERSTLLGHMVGGTVHWPVGSIVVLQQSWPQLFNNRIEQTLGQSVLWGRADVISAITSLPRQEYNAVNYAIDREVCARDKGRVLACPGFYDAVLSATRNCNASAIASLLRRACFQGAIELLAALAAVPAGRRAVPAILAEATKTWREWTVSIPMLVSSIDADVANRVVNDQMQTYITVANATTHPLLRALISRNRVSVAAAKFKCGSIPRPHYAFLIDCKRFGATDKFVAELRSARWPTWIRDNHRCLYPSIWPAMSRETATAIYLCLHRLQCLPPELAAIILAVL